MYTTVVCLWGLVAAAIAQNGILPERNKREAPKTIIDEPACAEVKALCNNLSENDNILILECLQSLDPSKLSALKQECQSAIWKHSSVLISDDNVRGFLGRFCSSNVYVQTKCEAAPKGELLKCLISNKEQIQENTCNTVLLRLENVAFQDYRWISKFLNDCKDDIEKLQCGRLDTAGWNQLQTVACLQEKILNVNDECKREVFKLSELQADSIKLDRQLYMACVKDHQNYCQQFSAGSGLVFKCLMEQPQHLISDRCHKQLIKREKLISQDYKVSKGLMRACKEDIKNTHCRRQTSSDRTVRLAQILLCLENVAKNGTTKLDPDCEQELVEHRRMLMEDFSLSPEVVDGCGDDIAKFCSRFQGGGETIHCLMEHARFKNAKKRLKDTCLRALESLVKETDAGEDWRVDPILHQACLPVFQTVCSGLKGGDARVIDCLMDNIGADHMTEKCEDAVIQLQYFIVRDFKLDPKLYRGCREEAVKLCHASPQWEESQKEQPSYDPQVLNCLYTLYKDAYAATEPKLSTTCVKQLQRVMRQRAISVDLHPEIEEVCLDDLGFFCSEKTKRGEEMYCLQQHLDELKDKCREAVESFTEIAGQRADLNPYIMRNCRREMEALCSGELKNDHGDIMECLISHKNDPSVKAHSACRTSIEHFQIISLKNYNFSYKFKVMCKTYAVRFCGKARTKVEVVTCLSEKVTNDTMDGLKSAVSKECRQQLKAQLLQQRENIAFDPKLKEACAADIAEHCADVEPGSAQILECLQSVLKKLSDRCEAQVFKIKKQEMNDNSVDYALMNLCADAIDQFCPHHDRETILECLRFNKDQKGFSKKCRAVVVHRMIEQNSNYQLNPSLQENCKLDINKFCSGVINSNRNKDMNAPVIKCLKSSFKKGVLSHKCEGEMVSILREQALDVSLNPLIRVVCRNELDTICEEVEDAGKTECLKTAFLNGKIMTPECKVEVASMIEESQADIQVDPLLQQVCALDLLKFCRDVPQGNGRHIKCLRLSMQKNELSPDCKDMLTKRMKMYENAALAGPPPEDLNALYHQVVMSPAKHYFILMFLMMFGSFFVVGILFGKAFRRQRTHKNK